MTPGARGVAFACRHVGLGVVALAMTAMMSAGCAKDPTEVRLTVGVDSTVTQQITSLAVALTWSGGTTGRVFQSLSAPAPDADIPAFYFPTLVDLLLTNDGVAGDTQILVEASDPTISKTVLASGALSVPIPADKTTTTNMVLTAVAPPATE